MCLFTKPKHHLAPQVQGPGVSDVTAVCVDSGEQATEYIEIHGSRYTLICRSTVASGVAGCDLGAILQLVRRKIRQLEQRMRVHACLRKKYTLSQHLAVGIYSNSGNIRTKHVVFSVREEGTRCRHHESFLLAIHKRPGKWLARLLQR